MKVGLIGSTRYENKRKIRETIFKLLQKFNDDLVIVSCGEKIGAPPERTSMLQELFVRSQKTRTAVEA